MGCLAQIQQFDPACRGIRRCEALVRQVLRVGEKLTLPSLGGQGAQTLSPLRLGIPDALRQQVIGVAVAFHGAGNPQAVNVEVSLRLNGKPCVLRRDIFDEALAPLPAPVKDKFLRKPLPEPFLLDKALFAGHGAADVLSIDVVLGDPNIIHGSPPLPAENFLRRTF